MLFKIDGWILARLEKFTHLTEKWFGWDCFWWGRRCVELYTIYALACLGFILWYNAQNLSIYGRLFTQPYRHFLHICYTIPSKM